MYDVILSGDSLDCVEDIWRRLWRRTAPPPPMLDFQWIRTWWNLHRDEGELLLILVNDHEDRPIGLAPLYRRVTSLRAAVWLSTVSFLGTGERERDEVMGEYNTWLAAPEDMARVTRQVAASLNRCAPLWDRLRLERLRFESRIHEQLPEHLPPGRHVWEASTLATFRLPVMPLADYLAALPSANFRHRCRRTLRAARERGAHLVRAETAAQRADMFEALRHLHQQRWQARGKPGVFASPVFTWFHQQLLEDEPTNPRDQRAWLLGLRGSDGALLAVRYCLRAGDCLYDYVSGVDTSGPSALAAGLALHLLTLEACGGEGVRHYDLMGGDDAYKHQLALVQDQMPSLDVFARSARARLWLAARDLRRQLVSRSSALPGSVEAPAVAASAR